MKDWRKSTLGELVTEGSANYQTGPFGTVLKASEFSKEGVPLISVGEIREGYIQILSSTPRVCERITTKLPKYILEEEDIVFGRKGAINRNAIIQKEQAGWFLGSDGIRLRLSDEHSSSFFSYQLRTSSIQEWLMNNGTGAIMPGLNQKILDRLPVYIPKLHIQQKIAKVLSTLDAKIELNNRINAELEGMAKLLYDYWFVQFEFPCLPDDYPSSGAGKLAKIAAACNYRSVGGLPIPQKGEYFIYVLLCADDSFYIGMTDDLYRRWFEHKTGQGAKWTKAQAPIKVLHHEVFDSRSAAAEREKELKTGFGRKWLKREYDKLTKPQTHTSPASGSPAHQSKLMQAGSPAHQSKLMQAGKMVFNPTLKREIPEGWEAGTLSDIARIVMGQSPPGESYNLAGQGSLFFQGSTDFGWRFPTARQFTSQPTRFAKEGDILLSVRAPVGTMNVAPFDCAIGRGLAALRSKSNHDTYLFSVMGYFKQIFDRRNTAGTTFGSINKDDLHTLQVVLPDTEIIESFEEKVRSGNTMIANNQKQNQELTELRDWLLPMLMNGQVTVQ
jgi:restriction endonuclease S subunit/predicted GIY-YIG superfamily endonuclease